MESAWKTQTNFWDNPALTKPFVRSKRASSRKLPDSITKKPKPDTRRETVLEEWLSGPCKINNILDTTPTHSLRACWILWQVAKSDEDLLLNHAAAQHPAGNNNTVFTVFKTFSSNSRRKRAQRSLAEVCHVATINPWNDTAITYNASDEPQFRTV